MGRKDLTCCLLLQRLQFVKCYKRLQDLAPGAGNSTTKEVVIVEGLYKLKVTECITCFVLIHEHKLERSCFLSNSSALQLQERSVTILT